MKNNKSLGAISRMLLILAAIVLIIIIVVFFVVRSSQTKKAEAEKQKNIESTVKELPKPVYEKQAGDIYFILESSENLGNALKAPTQYQKDLTTTEKFIKVVISAQNKGKVNTPSNAWDMGNIIDSEGRVFEPIGAYGFLPSPNPCGLSLKPEFYPVSCAKIYEVSRVSTGLKVEISAKDQKEKSLLDLKF